VEAMTQDAERALEYRINLTMAMAEINSRSLSLIAKDIQK
jgi:hypothetical protein